MIELTAFGSSNRRSAIACSSLSRSSHSSRSLSRIMMRLSWVSRVFVT